jgi:hypothetical protein
MTTLIFQAHVRTFDKSLQLILGLFEVSTEGSTEELVQRTLEAYRDAVLRYRQGDETYTFNLVSHLFDLIVPQPAQHPQPTMTTHSPICQPQQQAGGVSGGNAPPSRASDGANAMATNPSTSTNAMSSNAMEVEVGDANLNPNPNHAPRDTPSTEDEMLGEAIEEEKQDESGEAELSACADTIATQIFERADEMCVEEQRGRDDAEGLLRVKRERGVAIQAQMDMEKQRLRQMQQSDNSTKQDRGESSHAKPKPSGEGVNPDQRRRERMGRESLENTQATTATTSNSSFQKQMPNARPLNQFPAIRATIASPRPLQQQHSTQQPEQVRIRNQLGSLINAQKSMPGQQPPPKQQQQRATSHVPIVQSRGSATTAPQTAPHSSTQQRQHQPQSFLPSSQTERDRPQQHHPLLFQPRQRALSVPLPTQQTTDADSTQQRHPRVYDVDASGVFFLLFFFFFYAFHHPCCDLTPRRSPSKPSYQPLRRISTRSHLAVDRIYDFPAGTMNGALYCFVLLFFFLLF